MNRVRYAVRRGPQNPFRHLRFCRGCPVSDSNLLYRHVSTAKPWLPLSTDFRHENVANLDADTKSILSLYRMLIALRKKRPELVHGVYEPVAARGDLLLYRRNAEGKSITVALNLGAEPVSVTSASIGFGRKLLLSTFLDRDGEHIEGVLDLRGNEGVVVGDGDHAG